MTQTEINNTPHEPLPPEMLSDLERELGAEQIDRGQHTVVVESARHKGKYFYKFEDPDVKTPWIGIDKTGIEYEQHAFASKDELKAWLNRAKPEIPKKLDAVTAGRVDMLSKLGFKWNGEYYRHEGRGIFVHWLDLAASDTEWPAIVAKIQSVIDVAEPAFAGAVDFIAKTEAAMEFLPENAPIPMNAATAGLVFEAPDSPYANLTDDELRARVVAARDEFFPAYGKAAVLEALLKAAKQKFDEENATLIGDTKAAVTERGLFQDKLKTVAKEYGKRTDDKQFDQYIAFREQTVVDYDEPQMIAWCTQNYPAALINPGVTVDRPRITTYVKDCLKKKQPLPPSVKVTHPIEVTISSKIPVPELEEVAK